MAERIFVTGAGIVSALGVGCEATLKALLNEESGIGEVCYVDTEHREFPVGEVKLSNEEMARILEVEDISSELRTVLLGKLALREAIESASLAFEDIIVSAFINGTTVGGMDLTERYFPIILESDGECEDVRMLRYNDCGFSTDMITRNRDKNAENRHKSYLDKGRFRIATTASTACSSAANAIILAANLIKSGVVDIAVAGGSEALTKFHLNGFNTLMILDQERCRPFDKSRAGINLGEGAAYIVLESERSMKARGVKALGELSGYGNACDAFHQTATSENGEGAYRAMKNALAMAGLKPSQIDYINAHGTGTPNNDATEGAAMMRIMTEGMPKFSSTKSLTGHTTSASGSIESVISLLALNHDFVPGNLGWQEPMESGLQPVTRCEKGVRLNHVINNSFGFGGNDTTLIFSRTQEEREEREIDVKKGSEEERRGVYVAAMAQVSNQTPLNDDWMENPSFMTEYYIRAQEPDTKGIIAPGESRRMSKILKRSVCTSMEALKQSGVSMPDAIITGTGMGCIENSEKFLIDLAKYGENCLKPTLFMQSTHNTISSQIAIMLKCHGYNNTYSQRAISFESALLDAWLQMRGGMISSALVGSHDEVTPMLGKMMPTIRPDYESVSENSVSVMLTDQPSRVKVEDVKLFFRPRTQDILKYLDGEKDGVIVMGINGNGANDLDYYKVLNYLSFHPMVVEYKHIFGENYSSSAMAFYCAGRILEKGRVPGFMIRIHPESFKNEGIRRITLLNNSDGWNWSIIRLCLDKRE